MKCNQTADLLDDGVATLAEKYFGVSGRIFSHEFVSFTLCTFSLILLVVDLYFQACQ